MNISSIKTADSMDVLSPLKTSLKQSQDKPDSIKSVATNGKQETETANQIKTEQNRQLKNDTKLQDKQKEEEKQRTSMEDAEKMVKELNDYMDELQTTLGFSVTKNPDKQVIFQIKDRKTDEVIRQIPTEEIQKIKQKMNELTGLLLDQHV